MNEDPPTSSSARTILSSPSGAMAVLWAAASSGMLAMLWVIVRQVSEEMHPLQITFFASIFGFLIFLPTTIGRGRAVFVTRRFPTHLIRSAFNSAGVLTWFTAITLMPLADAAALNLMMPLVVAMFAMIFLGESVGPRRWMALAVGIGGALIIIRPGFEQVSLGVWLVLATVVCGASQRVIGKSLTSTESSSTSVVYLMGLMSVFTFIAAITVWKTPSIEALLWTAVVGALLSGAHFAFIHSISLADVSALEPVNFTRLVFAAILGFVFFAEVPDVWTWVGGLVIIGSTTYVARREAKLKAQKAALPDGGV